MQKIAYALIVTAGLVGQIGSAVAADMTGPDIKTLISGKSIYLETTAASSTGTAGQGVIYYAEDGSALYKTPTGALWHGKWEIKGNTACTDWKEKPNNPCTRWDKTGDTVSLIDVASGQTRAKVVKTAAGNPEKLMP